jgi:hypothetical protein
VPGGPHRGLRCAAFHAPTAREKQKSIIVLPHRWPGLTDDDFGAPLTRGNGAKFSVPRYPACQAGAVHKRQFAPTRRANVIITPTQ